MNNNTNMLANENKPSLNNFDAGQMNSENEERYVGQLVNGLRHGKGTVYYKDNGKVKYKVILFVVNMKDLGNYMIKREQLSIKDFLKIINMKEMENYMKVILIILAHL